MSVAWVVVFSRKISRDEAINYPISERTALLFEERGLLRRRFR